MDTMNHILLFLLPLLAAASITDLERGRIPNFLIMLGLLAGIPFCDRYYLVRFFVIIIIGILLQGFGFFGAGDIKLTGLIIAYMGLDKGIYSILVSLVLAGAVSLVLLIKRNILIERLRLFAEYISIIRAGSVASYRSGARADKNALIPMAPILLAGVVITIIIFVN